MCLILLALHSVPNRPWLLLGNRDEYHGRPTLPAAAWSDDANVIGGRDLEAGGSWLAVNRNGRFATVTNVRSGVPRTGKRSRGALVADFVRGTATTQDFAVAIAAQRDEFGPFNLIVGDAQCAWMASSLDDNAWPLADGIHVFSNGSPQPRWPKAQRLADAFAQSIQRENVGDAALLDALADRTEPHESVLPDTGVGLELERFLAPIFIEGNEYGTRASTLAYANDSGTYVLNERRFGPRGLSEGETRLEF